jgi:hypothetical protein
VVRFLILPEHEVLLYISRHGAERELIRSQHSLNWYVFMSQKNHNESRIADLCTEEAKAVPPLPLLPSKARHELS